MTTLSARLAQIPPGSAVLFFIQTFATLGFAVLYSSLVLYATEHLHFSAEHAALIMGVFGAFNYGLHLFGGYLGGRFLSNRNLFVGGMLLQVLGCAALATGSEAMLYWGLALFLTGSGLNVTCLNMMLTQRFAPEDSRREGAFLWNYAGMNVGFFIGFTMAGHYQLSHSYSSLFWFATLGNAAAIVLALIFWRTLADIDTPLLKANATQFKLRFAAGCAILVGLVPVLWWLLQHPHGTESLVKWISAGVALALLVLTLRHRDAPERRRMWAYLVLTLGSLMFWSLYQMAPSGLQLFAVGNVRLELWGVTIAPQWVQNINSAVIVIGGPLLSAWFARLRARGWPIDVPQQFAASLLLMGLGFLALPLGIHYADAQGQVAFVWLFTSYVLQSIGELLISPVGYAMIGRLAPRQYQGVMMGSWMLVTGLASLFAADFSGMVAQPPESTALSSNPAYAQLFTQLGLGSVAVGIALIALVPWLSKLIKNER
ncbi:oligopeptide:H+ symporter [Paucibacter sp. APW11]|uniref:Oligopeptide:H+ symporter n=1 Tax=Roseateles aquae TaxID=3077235 RepID=A0ABU3P802_9BURK|nr:oligopeptide:H+ symporter [Paucibacter sp. APW11]MDT8998623.1 oligopeptide:H+ symporter [Paucibacter sp. APW11]